MNKVIGVYLVAGGALVVFGGLTGRLPAILAAVFKPSDLVTPTPAGAGHPALTAGLPGSHGLDVVLSSIPGVNLPYQWWKHHGWF